MRTFLLLAALATTLAAQPPFALKPNDRVVFFGDSITDQRLYTTFAETFVVTRFPQSNITFTHSGWGGDRSRAAVVALSMSASGAMSSPTIQR